MIERRCYSSVVSADKTWKLFRLVAVNVDFWDWVEPGIERNFGSGFEVFTEYWLILFGSNLSILNLVKTVQI